jgi:hypothetical protein
MKFVKQMFRDRGYNERKQKVVFDKKQRLWEIFTETKDKKRVMAVFVSCKPFGDVMQIEEFTPEVSGGDAPSTSFKGSEKSGKANASQNTGMDFVKGIVKFSIDQNVKIVVLVTDFMTPHALKYIAMVEEVAITHFTYEETGIERMAEHISQPVVFRVLTPAEKSDFIRKHPRYMNELQRYSIDDALVKYYGMHLGDIVYIEDNDRQTALVVEYGLIVEDL